MPNIAKATAALATSVGSILDCDESDAIKREALAETFSQFQTYMERNGIGSDIAKADRAGPQNLSAALLNHLHDALGRKRQRHGFEKSVKESNMRTSESLESILKNGCPVALSKAIVDRGRSPCGEAELVAALTKRAAEQFSMSGERAFSRLYEAEESVRRACSIAKAAEFSPFDIQPIVVGSPDAMNAANDDDDSAVLRAHEEIVRIAREKFPFLPSDVAFARVFEDRNYAALAAQAHRRPAMTSIYKMPGSTDPGRGAYTKADPLPNADTAYSELMAKAEAYQTAHPELSISQAFSKVYTDRGNVELAKRERVESAPR
jgi:hypothetical protein